MAQALSVQIVNSPEEAPNYNRDEIDVRGATITKVVVVCNGTVEGRPTVDFQIEAHDGSKFVAMLTGALVQGIADAVRGAAARSAPGSGM